MVLVQSTQEADESTSAASVLPASSESNEASSSTRSPRASIVEQFESSLGQIDRLLDDAPYAQDSEKEKLSISTDMPSNRSSQCMNDADTDQTTSAVAPLESSMTSVSDVGDDVSPPRFAAVLPDAQWDSSGTPIWRHRMIYVASAALGVVAAVGVVGLLFNQPERDPSMTRQDGNLEPSRTNAQESLMANQPLTEHGPTKEPVRQQGLPHDSTVDASTQRVDARIDGPMPRPALDLPAASGAEAVPHANSNLARRSVNQDDEVKPAAGDHHKPALKLATPRGTSKPSDVISPRNVVPVGQLATTDRRVEVRYKPIAQTIMLPSASAALQTPVHSLQIDRMPLSRLMSLLGELSGAPITLDPESLRMNNMSAYQPVSLRVNKSTIDEALRAVLGPFKLMCQVDHGHVTVVARGRADRRPRLWEHDVADLAAGDADQTRTLARMVRVVVSPKDWTADVSESSIELNGDQLAITTSITNHFRIYSLLERLRLARGLPVRSKKRQRRFDLTPRSIQIDEVMARRVSVSAITEQPLSRILETLEEQSGATILANWRILFDSDCAPAMELSFIASEIDLRLALKSLLEPLGLGVWPVDARTVQITSKASLDTTRTIEFYPLDKLLTGDHTFRDDESIAIQRVKTILGIDRLPNHSGIVLDEVSHQLIALLPVSAHTILADFMRH